MSEQKNENNIANEQISCDICLKEIPISEAKNEEANDYVAHFCGLECYDQWRKQDTSEKD